MAPENPTNHTAIQETTPGKSPTGSDNGHSSNVLFESVDWVRKNAVDPLLNGVIAPYDGLAHLVNLPEIGRLEVAPAKELSPAWFVQSISGGVGALAPILLASAAIGGTMRSAGETFGARATTANVLKNPRLSLVLAAGAYEGIRTPNQGESRLANAVTGAAGVAVMMYGDGLVEKLPVVPRFASFAAIGAGTGAVRATASSLINEQRLPTAEELKHEVIDAAALNVLLPPASKGLFEVIDKVNTKMGRGVPIDRYVTRSARGTEPIADSPLLGKLVTENPWARVQEGPGVTYSNVTANRIHLNSTNNSLAEVGHELSHLQTGQSVESGNGFAAATKLLRDGNVAEAKSVYIDLRMNQETQAANAGRTIAKDLNIANKGVGNASDIGSRAPIPGKTYTQIWNDEFRHFHETNGAYRPTINYSSHGG